MERRRLRPVRLFCSDLDGTLIGDGDAAQRFGAAWTAIPPDRRPILVYSTGRMLDDAIAAVSAAGLPEADIAFGGVGTLLGGPLAGSHGDAFSSWLGVPLDSRAIATVLRRFGTRPQPARYQGPHKSSWYLPLANAALLARIERQLQSAGLDCQVTYSSNRDLDVLSPRGGKGRALGWLLDRLQMTGGDAVVAGDTGNDASMFREQDVRGITVANALPELLNQTEIGRRHDSRHAYADGVVDGLVHWGVFKA